MKRKEQSFLLVDGYNIIHAWEDLKAIAEESLEDARDRLIDILCDYRGFIDESIILVFDAHKVKGGTGNIFQHSNIYIVYTKEAETADHYIEKSVSKIIHNYNVTVATSDNLEQVIILAAGAVRISARELNIRISAKKEELRKSFIEKKALKENLLFDSLSPDTLKYLEDLRMK